MDNGPSREPAHTDLPDKAVYCVDCGTIFISGGVARDCPGCHVNEQLQQLRDEVTELQDELEAGGD